MSQIQQSYSTTARILMGKQYIADIKMSPTSHLTCLNHDFDPITQFENNTLGTQTYVDEFVNRTLTAYFVMSFVYTDL